MKPLHATLAALALLTSGAFAQSIDRPWNHDVIYFAMTDRFFDGDPANNVPPGSDPRLYDKAQTDIGLYHGGDLRGLELALSRGYFRALGVTALWITPPVRNVWNSTFDLGGAKSGYHGYWAQDFLDIDPHLTSATSLDGKTKYHDTRDGRLAHYRDFVALAHAQGVKVIQDIVCNHAGPVFFYDANGNGKFDTLEKPEWIQPFRRDGFHANTVWADVPAWSQHRTAPTGPLTALGRKLATTGILGRFDAYGRKGMNDDSLGKSDEDVTCDFFALRDIWTDPKGPHFDELVNEFVEIYAFYLETIGVDGLRIDTVKHVHRGFWDAFTARLRTRLGPEKARRTLIFGEVYSGNPQTMGRYTYREDFSQNKAPSLDSLLNFQGNDAIRDYLRHKDGRYRTAGGLERMVRDLSGANGAYYNPTPGLDGLTARQKTVNFVENHDGLNRFRVAGVSARQNQLANSLALTLEGIPCLYYGTELDLEDARGKIGTDSETGRRTLWPRGSDPAAMWQSMHTAPLATLIRLRRETPALREGRIATLWVDAADTPDDDGLFIFARYIEKDGAIDTAQTVIVVCNADAKERTKTLPLAIAARPLLREGQTLERATVEWRDGIPHAVLSAPPQSVTLFRVVKTPAQ